MNSNGTNGFHAAAPLQWKIGLLNFENKYLTAETFGNKINASGATLKKKQLWTLEHDSKNEDIVYLRSHLNRYLSCDKAGSVKCDSGEKCENEQFCIKYKPDGSGKWAIQSCKHQYFFGGSADNIRFYDLKTTGQSGQEWWTVHLVIHPQVNLRNVNRKRYACCKDDQIQCTEVIPWGKDALITIAFLDTKYALKTYDNRYLHREGNLVENTSKDTLFTLELKSGQNPGIAFKDSVGKYLSAVGQNAAVQGRNKNVTKDELFTLEDSHPQVFITAYNGKKVSIKQGIDATANQDELTDMETFQIEFDKDTQKWLIRTADDKYFNMVQPNGCGIQAGNKTPAATSLFTIEQNEDGSISFKASNGRYVIAKPNGSLYATSDVKREKESFYMVIINRPILVLRCDYGFVGFKSSGSTRIECNKTNSETIHMKHTGKFAEYELKGTNGKYWTVDDENNINADSDQPQPFTVQLVGQSRFKLRTSDGRFVKGEQNGLFQAKSADPSDGTDWEY